MSPQREREREDLPQGYDPYLINILIEGSVMITIYI